MPQGYPEPQDPRTGKAPRHQASATRHNISNTEIVENRNIPITIDELKSKTKVGDRYDVYYKGKQKSNKTIVITRLSENSIWHRNEFLDINRTHETRESWNTVLNYIKNRVYRRL